MHGMHKTKSKRMENQTTRGNKESQEEQHTLHNTNVQQPINNGTEQGNTGTRKRVRKRQRNSDPSNEKILGTLAGEIRYKYQALVHHRTRSQWHREHSPTRNTDDTTTFNGNSR